MRFFGKITDPKDLTTKEYVDTKCDSLDNAKLNKDDVEEYTEEEVSTLWDNVFNKETNVIQ